MEGNNEKLFLYTLIGILIAVVYILSMHVIKQYIQRKNIYRKILKPDIHEYESSNSKKPLVDNKKPPTTPATSKASNLTKSTKVAHSTSNLSRKNSHHHKEQQEKATTDQTNGFKPTKQSSRMSRSSTNLHSESLQDIGASIPMLQQYAHPRPSNAYERLNNNFNPNFQQGSSFVINQSHQNLYDYNNNNNNNNFDNYDGFKLITRNGSTKIVNGQNDDISEYEIPIIRYNDRPTRMQQYWRNSSPIHEWLIPGDLYIYIWIRFLCLIIKSSRYSTSTFNLVWLHRFFMSEKKD